MESIFSIIGWLLGLLMLPYFATVAFAQHVGVMLALNHAHPSTLAASDRETDEWSKRISGAVAFYWIIVGCFWLFRWGLLKWIMGGYSVILILMWFSGIRAIKRKVGL